MKTAMIAAALTLAAAAPALAGAVEEMMETDQAFAAMAQNEGVAPAFAAYAAHDVRMFPDGGASYSGQAKMLERFANWPEGATLQWTPVEGMAGAAGDFGFTWGRFVFKAVGENGDESFAYGKYVSVWRREETGNWKFVADIGNDSPAPEETP